MDSQFFLDNFLSIRRVEILDAQKLNQIPVFQTTLLKFLFFLIEIQERICQESPEDRMCFRRNLEKRRESQIKIGL